MKSGSRSLYARSSDGWSGAWRSVFFAEFSLPPTTEKYLMMASRASFVSLRDSASPTQQWTPRRPL